MYKNRSYTHVFILILAIDRNMDLLSKTIIGVVILVAIIFVLYYLQSNGVFGNYSVTQSQAKTLVLNDLQNTFQNAVVNITNVSESQYKGSWHIIASLSNGKIEKATLQEEKLKFVEDSIEKLSKEIPPLKQFVIPGGCEAATTMHIARSIARRMERSIVRAGTEYQLDKSLTSYANRLSSAFFTMALYLNLKKGIEEKHPTY